MLFSTAVKLLSLPFFLLVFQPRVRGLKGLGDAVLAANHSTLWDAALLTALLPFQKLYFLAADRLFHCPAPCRRFLRAMGAVRARPGEMPLDELLAIARRHGKRERIAFFPEGRIFKDGAVHAFQPGCAMLALEAGLPVAPVYLRVRPFWRGGSVVRVGEPLSPAVLCEGAHPDVGELVRISELLRARVADLEGRKDSV